MVEDRNMKWINCLCHNQLKVFINKSTENKEVADS